METLLQFVVPGEPVSKARARVAIKGDVVRSYTPQRTITAEQAVAWCAKAAGARQPRDDIDYGLKIEYFLASWQRRDVDNLTKLVLDALTGIVWADDSQVRSLDLSVEKGSTDPRTIVVVWALPAQRPPSGACSHCGKAVRMFASWVGRNRYCSERCREAAAAARRARPCRTCGVTFVPEPRRTRIYCSDRCTPRGGRPLAPPSPDAAVNAERRRDREYRARTRRIEHLDPVDAGPRPDRERADLGDGGAGGLDRGALA